MFENTEEEVRYALDAIQYEIFNLIQSDKYIPMSTQTISKASPITFKYICKRMFVFEKACPYTVSYVEFESDMQNGSARHIGKTIEISEMLPSVTKFETLTHEWAHQILHLRSNAPKAEYVVKELEAESVSFIVGYILGTVDEVSHSYINEKLEEVEQDRVRRLELAKKLFTQSEKRIVRAAMTMLKKLQPERKQLEYHHRNGGKYL